MKYPLIVGGASGIGLAIAHLLATREEVERIAIVDKAMVPPQHNHPKFVMHTFDLTATDYACFDTYVEEIDALIITAGFGKLALFHQLTEQHIIDSFTVNSTAVIRLIHRFLPRISDTSDFYCGVMVSIAGFMSSPFFSVYAATKAALKIFIESLNVELEMQGTTNRVLNISPGSIKGTGFAATTATDLTAITPLAAEIIAHLEAKDDLFIPQYDEVFRHVLQRYHDDFRAEGRHSYAYKVASGRTKS